MTIGELTAKFWTAAKFIRRNPNEPHTAAQALLRQVKQYATGALQQRTTELIKDDDNGPGTSYPG